MESSGLVQHGDSSFVPKHITSLSSMRASWLKWSALKCSTLAGTTNQPNNAAFIKYSWFIYRQSNSNNAL